MATYTELPLEQARTVGAEFGVRVAEAVGVPAGSVNSNYRFVLDDKRVLFARIYEEQDRTGAEGEARLLDHFARNGVATPRPLPRSDGKGFTAALDTERGPRAIALFPWQEGEILCQARITPEVAEKVGAKLAEIHRAGATFAEPRPGRFRIDDLKVRLERIAAAEDRGLRDMAPRLLDRLTRAEQARNPDLPHGIIHGDLFRDNVLWEDGQPVALLDFESACDGSWAYDLMVTALAWCYGSDLDERLVRAMFRGYARERRPTPAERAALSNEGRIGALRFTVTRITDFEMRRGLGDRVMKDYRRFFARHERLVELGDKIASWFE
jgi:homoserine kinase type II